MKLEFRKIAGEEIPFVILECGACGEWIVVQERDVKTSKPIHCGFCNHTRYLSYREYLTITDKFAAQLLEHVVLKLGRSGSPGCRRCS